MLHSDRRRSHRLLETWLNGLRGLGKPARGCSSFAELADMSVYDRQAFFLSNFEVMRTPKHNEKPFNPVDLRATFFDSAFVDKINDLLVNHTYSTETDNYFKRLNITPSDKTFMEFITPRYKRCLIPVMYIGDNKYLFGSMPNSDTSTRTLFLRSKGGLTRKHETLMSMIRDGIVKSRTGFGFPLDVTPHIIESPSGYLSMELYTSILDLYRELHSRYNQNAMSASVFRNGVSERLLDRRKNTPFVNSIITIDDYRNKHPASDIDMIPVKKDYSLSDNSSIVGFAVVAGLMFSCAMENDGDDSIYRELVFATPLAFIPTDPTEVPATFINKSFK